MLHSPLNGEGAGWRQQADVDARQAAAAAGAGQGGPPHGGHTAAASSQVRGDTVRRVMTGGQEAHRGPGRGGRAEVGRAEVGG